MLKNTGLFETLQARHEQLLNQEVAQEDILGDVQTYIEQVRRKSRQVVPPDQREQLRANIRYWASVVYERTGKYPNTELTPSNLTESPFSLHLKYYGCLMALVIIMVFFGMLILLFKLEPTYNGTQGPTPTPSQTPTHIPTLSRIDSTNVSHVQNIVTLPALTGPALHIAFSPDGNTVATSGADGFVRLWTSESLLEIATLTSDQRGWTQTVSFSSDGRWLAAGGNDKIVQVWDVNTLLPFAQFQGHEGFIFDVAFSPDNTLLASASGDGTVKLWEIETGRLVTSAKLGSDAIYSLAFSPDGGTIAVANVNSGFAVLTIPDLRSQCQITTLSALTTSFSPVGDSVAIGDKAGSITRVDPETCTIQEITTGHADFVNSVAFSSDGQVLISGGRDGVLFVLPGELSFHEHDASIESVAFSPDGRLIASADANGKIILWGVPEE